jgi:hypothetical protein
MTPQRRGLFAAAAVLVGTFIAELSPGWLTCTVFAVALVVFVASITRARLRR